MIKHTLIAAATAASLVACASGTKVSSAGGELAGVTPMSSDFIPRGTTVSARFDQSISTRSNEGDQFTATVTNDLLAQDGSVAIPAGAQFSGTVTGVHAAKFPGEKQAIRLNIDQLHMNGATYPFNGNISDVKVMNAKNASNKTLLHSAIGAAAGAGLGAIITGGDAAGWITGGLLGAGAGALISMGNGSTEPAVIPAGSNLTVQANDGVRIRP